MRASDREPSQLMPRQVARAGPHPIILVAIVTAVLAFLYAIHDVLLPFVLAGIVA